MWIPGRPSGTPTAPTLDRDLIELLGGEPAGRVGTDGVERDVAEVEETRVADDHVQADRHRREDDHHDHRVGAGDEVADQRQRRERLDDQSG